MCKLLIKQLYSNILGLIFSLLFLIAGEYAYSANLPEIQFYETSVASNFGNGCEFEAVYTMKYKPFRAWRMADNVAYVLWQMSQDGGITWANIEGQSGVNKDELRMMVEGTENLIFRAVVVSDSNVENAKKNALYIGENGIPANSNVKYTITKTLQCMKPEATCEYDPDYLCTRYETFGLCGTHSCSYDTAIKVNKYIPGGTEKMTWGQYLLCSNPDSAIYTKDCEDCPKKYQFASVKDADGNVIDSSATSKLIPEYIGDAFAFIMMSRDEYKKIPRLFTLYSGYQPLCPCKDYVFYTFISCVGEPNGTRLYPKLTVLDPRNGDTLATQTYFYTYKGFELNKPTLQFTPPSDYNIEGFIGIIELDYESVNSEGKKMDDYVTFSMDECAFSVCGVRVPSHGSGVDQKPYHILSNGFYCRMDEGKRVGQWFGYEEWKYRHPDAAFLWLRKNTPDSPWMPLPAETDTIFTYSWEENEYHATYRVLLAESAEVIQQELDHVFPDDPCAIRTEPYDLGFYCEEYKCPKTKFTFVEGEVTAIELDTSVCYNRNDAIKIQLYQNNDEPIDAFYVNGIEMPIVSETSGKKHTLYVPAKEGRLAIYAMSDTCKTDSVFFIINKDVRVEFENIDDSGNREIVVEAKGGSCSYNYDFGDGYQPYNILTDIKYGAKYKISVMDEDGCQADTVFQTNKYSLELSSTFTPNGDGMNDKWEIKNIEKYPSAEISVFDRFGKKIYCSSGSDFDGWDGTYLGKSLPTSDYWYEIYIPELDKTYVGHFTLFRE